MNWVALLDQSNLPMIILFGLGWFSLWRKISALEARISHIEGVMGRREGRLVVSTATG